MTPFADLEAFAEYRQTDYDASDVGALRALEGATALIRATLRQVVTLVEDDVVLLDGMGLYGLLLPQLPVVEVSDITLLNPDAADEVLEATDFYVDASGILWRQPQVCWPYRYWNAARGNVQVTYTHGYDTIPPECEELCLSIAARRYTVASTGGTIESQTIGGASVTYGASSSGETNARGLTADEDALVRAFPWPAVLAVEAS